MIRCPYCNGEAQLVDSAVVYGGRSYGNIWLCELCDAYVGCHEGTDKPKGTLADAQLRALRKFAHSQFDPLWQAKLRQNSDMSKAQARGLAYKWLADTLGMNVEDCHIAMMGPGQCRRVIAVCRPYTAKILKKGARYAHQD